MSFAWPWGAPLTHKLAADGEWPRISIVTPNYNGAKYIEATLRSVICQGYPNLQYIVVDGASRDESMQIIERYADHIDHIICEKDTGHADAINKGFAKADGEILAWLNSDDLYHPWSLFTVAELFKRFPEVRWIEGQPMFWDETGRLYSPGTWRPFNQYDFLTGRYDFIQQESTFWRRSLWEEAGGRMNTDYRIMVDGELWSRFFLHAPLYRVETVLGGFRVHLNNRSHDRTVVHAEMKRAIETMRGAVSPGVRARAQRFAMLQAIAANLPTETVRTLLARWAMRSDFLQMGYDVIRRRREDLDWSIEPFQFR